MKNIIKILIGLIIIVVCVCVGGYFTGIGAVDKKSKEPIRVVVEDGMYSGSVINLLQEKGLVKNKLAAKVYLKLHNVDSLKAGKYDLYKSEDLKTLLSHIENGDYAGDDVKLTIIEGKNVRWIAKKIAENTNNTEDDVYDLLDNEEYIESIISKYWFITDDIKNEEIYYPLEGYLFPDTYTFEDKDVDVKTIFETILNHAEKNWSKYQDEILDKKINIHTVLTLASLAELEGNSKDDRAEIVGVFLNRLNKKMSLGSDVSTYYAFKVDMGERDLTRKELNTENPYNTRGPNMIGKLPIGPICNPSLDAIDATIHYKKTDNLFFVADKNGKVYFTQTDAEHQKKIKELKNDGLWYTYE